MIRRGASLILMTVVLAGCSTSSSSPGAIEDIPATESASMTEPVLVAVPSIDELAALQGFAFLEDNGWMDAGTAEGAWVASTLNAAQSRQAGIGALQQVDPAPCEPVALMAGYGWTTAASEPSSLTAVGYGKRRSNSGQAYPTAGSIDEWEAIAYQLPQGRPQEVADGLARSWESCATFALVDADGRHLTGERAHNLTPQRGWAVALVSSGNAVIREASMEGPVGARQVTVVEPIGDVLLVTRIGIWSTDDQLWQRAMTLYNAMADQVAAGAERPPVDLAG